MRLLDGIGESRARPLPVNPDASAGGWLELLASGLTFDLSGLEPGQELHPAAFDQYYGAPQHQVSGFCLRLEPGPHIRSGALLMPVVRIMADVARHLSELLPVSAIGWPSAGTCMEPRYFCRVVDNWLGGGPFPALGLTAILRTEDGGAISRGLESLTGQELRLDAAEGEGFADTAKLAARLVGELVDAGGIGGDKVLFAPSGEALRAVVSFDKRLVHFRRNS